MILYTKNSETIVAQHTLGDARFLSSNAVRCFFGLQDDCFRTSRPCIFRTRPTCDYHNDNGFKASVATSYIHIQIYIPIYICVYIHTETYFYMHIYTHIYNGFGSRRQALWSTYGPADPLSLPSLGCLEPKAASSRIRNLMDKFFESMADETLAEARMCPGQGFWRQRVSTSKEVML